MRTSEALITLIFVSYFLLLISGVDFLIKKSKSLTRIKVNINGLALLVYIFLAYFFYLINSLNILTISLLLIGTYHLYQKLKILRIKEIFRKKVELLTLVFIIIVLVFGQSFDALSHFSQNHPDSLSTLRWWEFLSKNNNPGYPPGVLLLTSGIINVIDVRPFINFLGLAISLVVNMEAYRLLQSVMKKNSLKVFFLIILLPIFGSIIFTRIGFNAGQITFLILLHIIVLVIRVSDSKSMYIHLVIILVSGLLIQPQVMMVLLIALIISIVYMRKQRFIKNTIWIYSFILIFFILTVIYYLLLSDNSLSTFGLPDLKLAFDSNNFKNNFFEIIKSIIYTEGNIRPPNDSLISLGSYAVLVGIILLFFWSRNKEFNSLLIFSFSLGVITNTGILEIDYFKGRVGFYFFYSTIIIALVYLEKLRLSNIIYNMVIVILGIVILINPPISYRIYDERVYFDLKTLKSDAQVSSVYSQFDSMESVDSQFKVTRINSNLTSFDLNSNYALMMRDKPQLIVLNNSSRLPDVKLSNQLGFSDRDFDKYYETIKDQISTNKINNELLTNLLLKDDYLIAFEETEYLILALRHQIKR
jgi:hypothetical protein